MYRISLCNTALMDIMYGVNGDFCSIKYRTKCTKIYHILPTINVVLHSKILLTHKEHCYSYDICDRL